ncbi:hypothetical protein [Shewanella sp. GXUN23E]|uniref:hypothetical protein n=1 Tax=Shewanella sp. GXUN23E TaxID=3422498 RepID=UPI003D7E3EC0
MLLITGSSDITGTNCDKANTAVTLMKTNPTTISARENPLFIPAQPLQQHENTHHTTAHLGIVELNKQATAKNRPDVINCKESREICPADFRTIKKPPFKAGGLNKKTQPKLRYFRKSTKPIRVDCLPDKSGTPCDV